MLVFHRQILIATFLLLGSVSISAQAAKAFGSLEVSGRVRIDGKQEKLSRKRFYLFRGSLSDNRDLVERLKAAEITSRDCFYSRLQASLEFICWLKAENCESPYCRKIEMHDIEHVPEFQAAYEKGLSQFRGLSSIAQEWLTTNLPSNLVSGYFQERRTLTDTLLAGVKPLQSTMTDSVTVKAIFIDIPINADAAGQKKSETFLVSNILPIEFGGKSYVWTCEVEIGAGKTANLRLLVPESNKPVKNCEVTVKDLQVCKTGSCDTK